MNKLEQYLNLASRAYYSGAPIITDEQFDRLAESIGYNAVGAKQHGNVERHVYQMYSLQKYYEDRFSMMGNEGWKDLCIDIDIMIESLNNLSVIPDEKTLMFKKGELSILTWLKTLKEVSERAYEELNEKNL